MKSNQKLLIVFLAILLLRPDLPGQNVPEENQLTPSSKSKIISGLLFEQMDNAMMNNNHPLKKGSYTTGSVILYFKDFPSDIQVQELEDLGVVLRKETWTPPVGKHPDGFMVASVPFANLPQILKLSCVMKADATGRVFREQNNDAARSIKTPLVWETGLTGKGVTVGVLDSGIDTTYKGTELPVSFRSKDYSYFPLIDNDVTNPYSGHGTHVTGTILGRGILSAAHSHSTNGKGSFKGMAPGADLVLLKIGQDDDAFAYDSCLIAAIDAAVNIYHADILSMSYGGWDDYHDGTSALEQKVDWAYSMGVPFFASAGNDADKRKHWMGTIPANSESDFIEVNVSTPGKDSVMLRFNMVWNDGTKRNSMKLQYYDSLKNLLTQVITFPTTESIKGTESCYSYFGKALKAKNRFYLKIVNQSAFPQEVHIYEDWSNLKIGTDHVSFTKGESAYTIGSPSTADHAFSVGAYVSKTGWTSSANQSYWWGASSVLYNIAPFSSHGPRMDGKIKPDICAPGSVVISLRDQKAYTSPNYTWIDNDGIKGGDANYLALRGTSMACPVVSGSAALFLEKYPIATPEEIYSAFRNYSDRSGLTGNLPDNTWGNGKLDIFSALSRKKDTITIDGNMQETVYTTPGKFTSGRDASGPKIDLGALKFFSDGKNLFIGITGETAEWNSIILFLGFSGVNGRGTNTLGTGNPADSIDCVFEHTGDLKMDFDVDFALAFNKKGSSQYKFYLDAIRFGTTNKTGIIGQTNQMGAASTSEIGSVFGGTGYITFAYDSSYAVNPNKGIEMKIPVSAFGGVDTTQTLQLFAIVSGWWAEVSNECIPGDPGPDMLWGKADFSAIPDQDFFTRPFKITPTIITNLKPPLPETNFSLGQNYPNPFSRSTNFDYSLHVPGMVSLIVYDFTGKEITRLVNKNQSAGEHQVEWDASGFSPGIYFYRLQAGARSEIKKMVLTR